MSTPQPANDSESDAAGPILGPVRSVVVRVEDLDDTRPFYEEGLGFQYVSEGEDLQGVSWDFADGGNLGVRLAASGTKTGMVDLIEESEAAGHPRRDPERPWDYGLLTLNVRMRDLDRALSHLRSYGAEPISKPLAYEAGDTAFREVMVHAPGSVRFTLLQAGPAEPDGGPITGGIATVGVVVSDFEQVRALFGEGFGWSERVSMAHTGAPFDQLLGAPAGTRLRMAVFAAGEREDGKMEPLCIEPPDDTPRSSSEWAPRAGVGLQGVTLDGTDLDAIAAQCRRFGVSVQGPRTVEHPFDGSTTTLLITLPGGARIECHET